MSRRLACALLAIVPALAACGSVKTSHLADAPDGSGDGGPGDAAPSGAVQVTLIDSNSGLPAVGAQVLFTDSAQTQRRVTDGSGVASATVDGSATVTAFGTEDQSATFIQTVLGAKNGDQIALGFVQAPSMPLGTFTVTFPVSGDNFNYTVHGPCGSSAITPPTNATTASVSLSISSNCKTDPMELIVVESDLMGGAEDEFIDTTGIPFVANGGTTLSGPYKPVIRFSAQFTDATVATSVGFERFAPDDHGDQASATATGSNGAVPSVTVIGPTASTAAVETTVTRVGFGNASVLQKLTTGTGTTYGLDVDKSVLPWLGVPTFDLSTQTIQTTVDAVNSSGDVADLYFCVYDYVTTDATTNATAEYEWVLFGPTAGNMTLPALPADLAAAMPTAKSKTNEIECAELDSDNVAGYDVARQNPFAMLTSTTDSRDLTGVARFNIVSFNNQQ